MNTTKENAAIAAQEVSTSQGEIMEAQSSLQAAQVNEGATTMVAVDNNNNNTNSNSFNIMKNLLFIEGNRSEIDKANVVESYNKIKAMGFIPTMPVEFLPIEQAQGKLGDRRLLKPILKREKGEGLAVISNFKIEMVGVEESEYHLYDGVCVDGQHRTLALMFPDLEAEPSYTQVEIPEKMDVLQYIALRNNGKPWKNDDFYNSKIPTNDKHTDHILSKREEKFITAFLMNVYTFGTSNLTPKQMKALQQGYKTMDDYKRVQLSKATETIGDTICQICKDHPFLTTDKLNGRLGAGLKAFYKNHDSDLDKVEQVLNAITKTNWEKYFIAAKGQSMEAKAYEEAFNSVLAGLNQ